MFQPQPQGVITIGSSGMGATESRPHAQFTISHQLSLGDPRSRDPVWCHLSPEGQGQPVTVYWVSDLICLKWATVTQGALGDGSQACSLFGSECSSEADTVRWHCAWTLTFDAVLYSHGYGLCLWVPGMHCEWCMQIARGPDMVSTRARHICDCFTRLCHAVTTFHTLSQSGFIRQHAVSTDLYTAGIHGYYAITGVKVKAGSLPASDILQQSTDCSTAVSSGRPCPSWQLLAPSGAQGVTLSVRLVQSAIKVSQSSSSHFWSLEGLVQVS